MKRKRKHFATQEDKDDEAPCRSATGVRGGGGGGGGGKGIHRLNPHKNDFDFDYGAEYRAKASVTCMYILKLP